MNRIDLFFLLMMSGVPNFMLIGPEQGQTVDSDLELVINDDVTGRMHKVIRNDYVLNPMDGAYKIDSLTDKDRIDIILFKESDSGDTVNLNFTGASHFEKLDLKFDSNSFSSLESKICNISNISGTKDDSTGQTTLTPTTVCNPLVRECTDVQNNVCTLRGVNQIWGLQFNFQNSNNAPVIHITGVYNPTIVTVVIDDL